MIEYNDLMVGFLAVYLLQLGFDVWMERANIGYLKRWGKQVPAPFEGFIDAGKLSEINAYTVEKSRLGLVGGVLSDVVLLALILSGFLVGLDRTFIHWGIPYTLAGLLFFLVPGVILYVTELPFDYYRSFVIEEKFGFNRSTLQIWASDHVKTAAISLILGGVLLTVVFWLIRWFPSSWWIWGAAIVSLIQLLMAVLYPVFIAPLFNTFEPIQDELLAKRIRRLMEENGIRVKNILQMDAGLRSRHSNAYFTGLGRSKQIVLFDTLIESHSHDEILSVLAHEVGHFKKRHIVKQLVFFELSTVILFYFTYRLLDWAPVYTTFGFSRPEPYVGLFLLGIFWQKAGFFLQPFYMALSRQFEKEADRFAVRFLQTARPLITALKRMAADNLSNLTPHPLYVWFNYSHPPLLERITLLEQADPSDNRSTETTKKQAEM